MRSCQDCGTALSIGAAARCRRCFIDNGKLSRHLKAIVVQENRDKAARKQDEIRARVADMPLFSIAMFIGGKPVPKFVSLDAAISHGDRGVDRCLYDLMYEDIPSPFEELCAKEEWEEERKYIQFRLRKSQEIRRRLPRRGRKISPTDPRPAYGLGFGPGNGISTLW